MRVGGHPPQCLANLPIPILGIPVALGAITLGAAHLLKFQWRWKVSATFVSGFVGLGAVSALILSRRGPTQQRFSWNPYSDDTPREVRVSEAIRSGLFTENDLSDFWLKHLPFLDLRGVPPERRSLALEAARYMRNGTCLIIDEQWQDLPTHLHLLDTSGELKFVIRQIDGLRLADDKFYLAAACKAVGGGAIDRLGTIMTEAQAASTAQQLEWLADELQSDFTPQENEGARRLLEWLLIGEGAHMPESYVRDAARALPLLDYLNLPDTLPPKLDRLISGHLSPLATALRAIERLAQSTTTGYDLTLIGEVNQALRDGQIPSNLDVRNLPFLDIRGAHPSMDTLANALATLLPEGACLAHDGDIDVDDLAEDDGLHSYHNGAFHIGVDIGFYRGNNFWWLQNNSKIQGLPPEYAQWQRHVTQAVGVTPEAAWRQTREPRSKRGHPPRPSHFQRR